MTREELDESIDRAVVGFSAIDGVDESLSEKLVGEGFLSYDDLSIIEPDALMEMGEFDEERANMIVAQAETRAQEAEQAAALERRRQREQDRIDAATAAAEAAEAAERERQELEVPGGADSHATESAAGESTASNGAASSEEPEPSPPAADEG